MEMFLTVFMQVVILIILMALGFILSKAKVVDDNGIKSITEVVLLFVTPCVIIKSFIRKFDLETLKSLLFSFFVAIVAHILFIVLSMLLVRSKDVTSKKVMQFSVIFSNCGFMSLPLQQALLGDDGVFYCSAYITIFNLFIWSYGLILMSGDKKNLSIKKLVLNPGIIAFAIGIIIFVFSIPVPNVIKQPIEYMAALNTPLPMMIIGYHLANSNVTRVFKSFSGVFAILLRLIICPLIVMALIYICGIREKMFVSTVISACTPTGAMTTMFATKYNSDVELSVSLVSATTLLSIITMPIISTFAQYIA